MPNGIVVEMTFSGQYHGCVGNPCRQGVLREAYIIVSRGSAHDVLAFIKRSCFATHPCFTETLLLALATELFRFLLLGCHKYMQPIGLSTPITL